MRLTRDHLIAPDRELPPAPPIREAAAGLAVVVSVFARFAWAATKVGVGLVAAFWVVHFGGFGLLVLLLAPIAIWVARRGY